MEHHNPNPQDVDAQKIFSLWKSKLESHIPILVANDKEKFNILINRLGLKSFEYIGTATTYIEATGKQERVYSKMINKIYAR